jgi:NADPH:quinone reductase-like Zn-dependent oxidoreductase
MSKTGAITTEIPAVLGSDFCGLVVQDGPGCNKLQTGDYVFGLCRLGRNQFSPFQETFLVDEDLVFRKDGRIEPEAAAGVGLGVLTSALGIVVGGKKPLPHHGTKIAEHDEWIVVLGGSGSVGHYAVQVWHRTPYRSHC